MALRSFLSALTTNLPTATTATTATATTTFRRLCTTTATTSDGEGEEYATVDPVYMHLKEGKNHYMHFGFSKSAFLMWIDLPGVSQEGFEIRADEENGRKQICFIGNETKKHNFDKKGTPTRAYAGSFALDPVAFDAEKVTGRVVNGRCFIEVPRREERASEEGRGEFSYLGPGEWFDLDYETGYFRLTGPVKED